MGKRWLVLGFVLGLAGSRLDASGVAGAVQGRVAEEPGDRAAVDGAPGLGGGQGEGRREFVGFDANDYPGDAALPVLRKQFAFAGYWLNVPPGAKTNSWAGKREAMMHAGFGFLVLWNGRLDAELLKAQKAGTKPETLGAKEGAAAAAAARAEHFPPGATIFLDQEEGGRMLAEQAAYLLAWTEAVARSGFRPGLYGSGQPVPDGPGKTITTAEDVRARIRAGGLHEVAMWVYQDACPPANGCSLKPPPLGRSGTADAEVWQYAQSPRRPEITRSCAKTYAKDGNCYVPELPELELDLSVAASVDPSRGR